MIGLWESRGASDPAGSDGFEDRQRRWSGDDGADERLDALFRVTDGSILQAKHTRDIAAVITWMQYSKAGLDQLGIIGHSLGGQIAVLSLAVDPRISRGDVSCGPDSLASSAAELISHHPAWFEQRLGGMGVVATAVGCPVFVAAGRSDVSFTVQGVQEVWAPSSRTCSRPSCSMAIIHRTRAVRPEDLRQARL